MTKTMTVAHDEGDRFRIAVRQHTLWVDQPVSDGGTDTAPTPTEMFVAGLASCVAFYARRFLARHELPTQGLMVEADFEMAERPARVSSVRVRLRVPGTVPEKRRAGLLAVASHCTVHNSLDDPPVVTIEFADLETTAGEPQKGAGSAAA